MTCHQQLRRTRSSLTMKATRLWTALPLVALGGFVAASCSNSPNRATEPTDADTGMKDAASSTSSGGSGSTTPPGSSGGSETGAMDAGPNGAVTPVGCSDGYWAYDDPEVGWTCRTGSSVPSYCSAPCADGGVCVWAGGGAAGDGSAPLGSCKTFSCGPNPTCDCLVEFCGGVTIAPIGISFACGETDGQLFVSCYGS